MGCAHSVPAVENDDHHAGTDRGQSANAATAASHHTAAPSVETHTSDAAGASVVDVVADVHATVHTAAPDTASVHSLSDVNATAASSDVHASDIVSVSTQGGALHFSDVVSVSAQSASGASLSHLATGGALSEKAFSDLGTIQSESSESSVDQTVGELLELGDLDAVEQHIVATLGGSGCVDLSGEHLSDAAFDALGALVARCSHIAELKLVAVGLQHAQAARLVEAIARSASLRVLQLGGNFLACDGARAIAGALETHRQHAAAGLVELWLNDNQIGDAGAQELARVLALEHSPSLQSVRLHNNAIGDIGAAALAVALEQNSSLHTLDLHNNTVSEVGARLLAAALASNSALTECTTYGNRCVDTEAGAEAVAAIWTACQRNKDVR